MAISRRGALALAAVAATAGVRAQTSSWPNGPVLLICPYPAGGPNDLLARLVAKALTEAMGSPFIVENRVGAAGNIAAGLVAKARPDGQTLLFTSTGPTANNKFLYPNLTFDPQRDFASVALIAKSPVLIVARRAAPFSTIAELVAAAKRDPGKLNFGSAGYGTVAHIAAEYFMATTGVKMTHVPFAGSTPIIAALLGDQIDLAFDLIPTYVALIKDQRTKPIALTGLKHAISLPAIPTVAESGLPTFEATAWSAIVAPAGAPPQIIARVNKAINDLIASAEGKSRLADLEMSAEGGSPADLDAFIDAEIAKWGPIIRTAGLKGQ